VNQSSVVPGAGRGGERMMVTHIPSSHAKKSPQTIPVTKNQDQNVVLCRAFFIFCILLYFRETFHGSLYDVAVFCDKHHIADCEASKSHGDHEPLRV